MPTATIYPIPDRPEPLALIFLIGAIWLTKINRYITAAAFSAATALISPFTGILAIAGTLIMSWPRIKPAVAATVAIVGSCTLVVGVNFYIDPTSLARLLDYAAGHGTGLGAYYGRNILTLWYLTSFSSSIQGFMASASLLFSLILFCYLAIRKIFHIEAASIVFFTVLFLFPIFAFPGQYRYFVTSRASIPLLIAAAAMPFAANLRNVDAHIWFLLLGIACSIPQLAIDTLMAIDGAQSIHLAKQQALDLRDKLGSSTPVVLVSPADYPLYKEVFQNLADPNHVSAKHDLREIAAVANCYTGVRVKHGEVLHLPAFLDSRDWSLYSKAPLHTQISVLGQVIMRSDWGWSCDDYIRAK